MGCTSRHPNTHLPQVATPHLLLFGPSRRPLLLTLWWPTYSTSVSLSIPTQPLHMQSSTTHASSTLWLMMLLVALAYYPPPPCIFIFCKYHPQQFPSSKIGCYLSNSVLSSTISTMHGHQSEAVTFPTLKWLSYTCNGSPSAPTCISTTCFSTMESLPLKPFRCTHTGFIMGTTPNNLVPGRTQLQRCGALLLRPTYWRASWTPQNPLAPLLKTLISGCCTWH